jgi:hypothetical protein
MESRAASVEKANNSGKNGTTTLISATTGSRREALVIFTATPWKAAYVKLREIYGDLIPIASIST